LPDLAELDRRRLYAKLGYSSMFTFCVQRFRMSEATAVKRIRAARAAQRFPILLGMIARAEIHLSGLHRLSAHLTADNHRDVLAEAKHKTLKEIDAIVAQLAPKPDVPSSLRALPRVSATATPEPPDLFASVAAASAIEPAVPPPAAAVSSSEPAAPPPAAAAASMPMPATPRYTRAPDPIPLAPRKYKLAITLGEEGRSNLHQLQGLHAHRIPSGDPAAIVELALRTLLEQSLKQKAALTDKPRASRTEPESTGRSRSRAIPAAIKRAVWERDGGSCAYVGSGGKRCNETRCLEYAHIDPWAKGGAHTVDNIALRCRPHSTYEAVRDYGGLFMQRKLDQARSVREPAATYRAA
jgi:5-methylcytosine-specific restriction endonuclease McrA